MWDGFVPWLASGGGVGIAAAVTWLVYRLHVDAVAAERHRAESAERREADWRTAWQAERDRADVHRDQIGVLLGRTAAAKEPP